MPAFVRLLTARTLILAFTFTALCWYLLSQSQPWDLPTPGASKPKAGPEMVISDAYSSSSTSSSSTTPSKAAQPSPSAHSADPRCAIVPGGENVVIAVKTGATEAAERLSTQMMTSLRCAPNLVFFSDKEQYVGDFHLLDSLDKVPESAMANNPDFDMYKKQKGMSAGQIDSMLKGWKPPHSGQLGAWTLDKYKMVHILEKTWTLFPNKEWYIFIDADTYLVWPNLLRFLETRNKTEKLYFGSKAYLGGTPFAHGGSGIMVSGPAMYDFVVTHNGTAAKWDIPMKDKCCGDAVIGIQMLENGIEMENFWPTVNGEKPATLPFGPNEWCHPIVTMHHVTPAEMAEIDTFERQRKDTETPMTFKEVFEKIVRPILPQRMEDWDNLSGEDRQPVANITECRERCAANSGCFQLLYDGADCKLAWALSIGGKKDPNGDQHWISEWNTTRFDEWAEKQGACTPKWPQPH